jgi:hypothetical protein
MFECARLNVGGFSFAVAMAFEDAFDLNVEHTAFVAGETWLAGQLERVCDNRRQIAKLEADEVRLLIGLLDEAQATAAAEEAYECGDHGEQIRRYELRVRSHATEVAASLNISVQAAEQRLAEAWTLGHELRATLAALDAGEISRAHVHELIHETAHLAGSPVRLDAETELLPWAKRLAPAPFRKKAKHVLETLEKDSVQKRHERAFAKRRVEVTPARDGMAHLDAYIDLTDAARIKAGLENAAQDARAAGDTRATRQLEADFTVELLLDGNITIGTIDDADARTAPVRERAAVTVDVLIPAETLAGKNTQGAVIPGLGTIDPVRARELVALAPSLRRILTDPVSGAIVNFDRKTYRVPAELKRIPKLRDGHCRAPACTLPTKSTELGHTKPYAKGGTTALAQLAHLCDNHHHVKHEAGWHLTQYLDGVLHWRAPSGRVYRTYPERYIPAPPPDPWRTPDSGEPAPFDVVT